LLSIKNLYFSYNNKRVLNNLNFNFKSPGKYLILGANGTGKTTLLNILSGFLKPQAGSILYDNISISKIKILSSLISYLPENYYLLNNYKLNEYLRFYKKKDKIFFTKLNLDLQARYKNLSQGYKQRFNMFLFLSNKKYILIDDLLKFQDENNDLVNIIKTGFNSNTLIVSSPRIINEIDWTKVYILQDGVIF